MFRDLWRSNGIDKWRWVINLVYYYSDFYFNPYNIYGKCYQLPFYNEKGELTKSKRFKLHPMKEGVVG